MIVALVVAVTKNGVIGRENMMPWHLPADLAYFKRLTSGYPVIMGRKTHESIGRALPNRTNIVITHQSNYTGNGDVLVANSLDKAITLAKNELATSNKIPTSEQKVFVIGGGQIFADALPLANRVYLNRIDTNIAGDTFFPELDDSWECISREHRVADKANAFALTFEVYSR